MDHLSGEDLFFCMSKDAISVSKWWTRKRRLEGAGLENNEIKDDKRGEESRDAS